MPSSTKRVDVGFKFVCFHGRIDCLSPKFHCDIVWDQLAFAGVIKECLPDFRPSVDGAEYIPTGAVIKARDRPERFALCAFAAAGCAKKNKRLVSHHLRNPLILQVGCDGKQN